MIEEFRNFIENQKGWKLLWNQNETSRSEESAQLLFLGITSNYCRSNDIDISAEANIGRGPVDFKMSSGYSLRALIELKLARNTRFWNGLEKQLPKYLEAESVSEGRFVVIVYNEKDIERTKGIKKRTDDLNSRTSYTIKSVLVDAQRDPVSASKL